MIQQYNNEITNFISTVSFEQYGIRSYQNEYKI